jgi:DMSO reductase anchor subunit
MNCNHRAAAAAGAWNRSTVSVKIIVLSSSPQGEIIEKPAQSLKTTPTRRADALSDFVPTTWVAKSLTGRLLMLLLAVGLLLLGLLGWIIPLITGVPFLIASVVAVAMASHRVCRWVNFVEGKFPVRLRRGLRRCQHGLRVMRDGLRKRWRRLKRSLWSSQRVPPDP